MGGGGGGCRRRWSAGRWSVGAVGMSLVFRRALRIFCCRGIWCRGGGERGMDCVAIWCRYLVLVLADATVLYHKRINGTGRTLVAGMRGLWGKEGRGLFSFPGGGGEGGVGVGIYAGAGLLQDKRRER